MNPAQPDPSSPPNKEPGSSAPIPDRPPEAARKLSAEEQLALFEDELKETDWGHQPC